jgi:hypothetical protein
MARMCYQYGDSMDCDRGSCISPMCEQHKSYLEANAAFDNCDRCELEQGKCRCGEHICDIGGNRELSPCLGGSITCDKCEHDVVFNCAIGRC